jgi:hypothetical protein
VPPSRVETVSQLPSDLTAPYTPAQCVILGTLFGAWCDSGPVHPIALPIARPRFPPPRHPRRKSAAEKIINISRSVPGKFAPDPFLCSTVDSFPCCALSPPLDSPA